MEGVQELQGELAHGSRPAEVQVQSCGYLLELSFDWIVLRASENIHRLLRESHVTLIDEPLGRFVHSQALHDLRNLFSRLSGTTGVGRAYGIRLTDEPDLVDVAFHLSDGHVLLEAVPSAGSFGEYFGSVGGLAAGLAGLEGQALLDNGARRMRALTGYDRVVLTCGAESAQSSRGGSSAVPRVDYAPTMVADSHSTGVPLFPRKADDSSARNALLRACDEDTRAALRDEDVRSCLRIPFSGGAVEGEFRCDCRTPRPPNFELHGAAELFAQMFAMQLEIARLRR